MQVDNACLHVTFTMSGKVLSVDLLSYAQMRDLGVGAKP